MCFKKAIVLFFHTCDDHIGATVSLGCREAKRSFSVTRLPSGLCVCSANLKVYYNPSLVPCTHDCMLLLSRIPPYLRLWEVCLFGEAVFFDGKMRFAHNTQDHVPICRVSRLVSIAPFHRPFSSTFPISSCKACSISVIQLLTTSAFSLSRLMIGFSSH